MISTAVIIALWTAAVCTTIVPIVITIILCVKKKISIVPFFVGAAGFFIAQPILRMTIMGLLGTQQWYVNFLSTALGVVIIGGFTAGLFEETARLAGGKLLKSRNTYHDSISYGLGHGFCEVVFLGVSHFSNAILATMLSTGAGESLQQLFPDETMDLLITTFVNTPVENYYIGLAERVFAVTFHVAMTVLVFYGIRKKKIWCYPVAILAHTLLNGGAVLLMHATNVWISEAFMLVLAIVCLLLILRMRPKENCSSKELQ